MDESKVRQFIFFALQVLDGISDSEAYVWQFVFLSLKERLRDQHQFVLVIEVEMHDAFLIMSGCNLMLSHI